MDTALIISNVTQHVQLTLPEQAKFAALLTPKHAKRKEVLLQTGQVCTQSLFVNAGCLRGYTITEDGDEHVLSFAPPGWWIADMYSLVSTKPSLLNISALDDTDYWELSKTNQEQLFIEVPKFERLFRILTERSLVAYQQRVLDATTLTAEERYLKFCRYYPTLIDTLPQKQIASFIGVTPEFFSKMRSKLLRIR
jgi:CRP-like cAMP-binding protein